METSSQKVAQSTQPLALKTCWRQYYNWHGKSKSDFTVQNLGWALHGTVAKNGLISHILELVALQCTRRKAKVSEKVTQWRCRGWTKAVPQRHYATIWHEWHWICWKGRRNQQIHQMVFVHCKSFSESCLIHNCISKQLKEQLWVKFVAREGQIHENWWLHQEIKRLFEDCGSSTWIKWANEKGKRKERAKWKRQ